MGNIEGKIGSGPEIKDEKARDSSEAFRLAENPNPDILVSRDTDAGTISVISLEKGQEILGEALKIAAHGNLGTAAEILKIGIRYGYLQQTEILPKLMDAVKEDVEDQTTPDQIVSTLLNAYNFIGNTLARMAGVSDAQEVRQHSIDGFKELAKNRKGIFDWKPKEITISDRSMRSLGSIFDEIKKSIENGNDIDTAMYHSVSIKETEAGNASKRAAMLLEYAAREIWRQHGEKPTGDFSDAYQALSGDYTKPLYLGKLSKDQFLEALDLAKNILEKSWGAPGFKTKAE